MKESISKELLSEVLGHKDTVDSVKYSTSYANMELGILYKKEYESYNLVDCINIYELAHKCKEWAWHQGFSIRSSVFTEGSSIKGKVDLLENYTRSFEPVYGDTEPEAIFKACQWVLDNKDK